MMVSFELTGVMPLLMHADDVEAADGLNAWRKSPDTPKDLQRKGDDRSPAWTWQTYLYTDGEHVAYPSDNIMVALRQAGAQIILKGAKTYKEVTQSGLLISSEFCEFFCDGKQLTVASIKKLTSKPFADQSAAASEMGFKLFVKRAKVGQAKHVRVRPRFDAWSVRGEIEIIAPEIDLKRLADLFTRAGRVGIGDWRPGCKTPGPYGMFSARVKAA